MTIKEISIPPTLETVGIRPLGGIAVSPDGSVYVSLYIYPYLYPPVNYVGVGYANGSWGAPIGSDFSGPATGAVTTTRDGIAHFAGHTAISASGEVGAMITDGVVSGSIDFFFTQFIGTIPDMAGDSKGNLWFAESNGAFLDNFATVVKLHESFYQEAKLQLNDDYRTAVEALATAPNGDAWVATTLVNSSAGGGNKLYHISAADTILRTYALPQGSNIGGVAVASNDTVWLTDSSRNVIWKLSRRGAFSQYAIPTPASGVARITVGGDGALWFTERSADKIGRITTNGHLREYAVPTAQSAPTGISSLGPGCNPDVIWFVEQDADKIGEITIM